MKPRKQTRSGTDDLLRSRPENIIDLRHEEVRLGQTIKWDFVEEVCEAFNSEAGRPGKPGDTCRRIKPERKPPTSLKIRLEKPPSTRPTPLASVKPTDCHE